MTDYYVDGDVGNDTNAGTSEGSGNAWATIDKACQTMVAGDRTYVKASVVYDESAVFANVGTGRTVATMIQLIGYTATPGDNGVVQMNSTAGNYCLTDPALTNSYYRIHNFDFFGALISNVSLNGTIEFKSCTFRNAPNAGGAVGNGCQFYDCLFQNNGLEGMDAGNDATYIGCTFDGNDNINPWVTNNSLPRFYRCLFKNYLYVGGSNVFATSQMEVMLACTIDGRYNGVVNKLVDDITVSVLTDRLFCDNLIVGCDSRIIASSTASAGFSFGAYGNVIGDFNNATDGLFCTTSEGAGVDILGLVPSTVIGTLDEASADQLFAERYVDYTPATGSVLIGSGIEPRETV